MVVLATAAWLTLVVTGSVLGYALGSRSNHWITCIIGGVAGWTVMMIALWILVAFVSIKKDPKAASTD